MAMAEQGRSDVSSLVQNADALVQNVAGVVVARRELIEHSVVSVFEHRLTLPDDLRRLGRVRRDDRIACDWQETAADIITGRMSERIGHRTASGDVLEAARVLFNITQGARISWANGLVASDVCRQAIQTGVDLLFSGVEASDAPSHRRYGGTQANP